MTAGDAPHDVAVIGGGLVGAAIALGLAGRGERLALLDEGDVALRASRGNFGLVWVQSKGVGIPPTARGRSRPPTHGRSSRASCRRQTGIDVRFEQPAASAYAVRRRGRGARARCAHARAAGHAAATTGSCSTAPRVAARCAGIGPAVAGGTVLPLDGQ